MSFFLYFKSVLFFLIYNFCISIHVILFSLFPFRSVNNCFHLKAFFSPNVIYTDFSFLSIKAQLIERRECLEAIMATVIKKEYAPVPQKQEILYGNNNLTEII